MTLVKFVDVVRLNTDRVASAEIDRSRNSARINPLLST
jgi:hypothetical protein